MAVSVAVMAHPRRRDLVQKLVQKLGSPTEVVWDRRNEEWDTGRRALLAYNPSATHHLIVQDDALVCQDLVAAATQAAASAGERPVSFYTGRVRPHTLLVNKAWADATKAEATWLQMPGPWWGVALMLPTAHISDLVTFADRARHIQDYDRKIARWYYRAEIACWYSVPSLVDHRPDHETPTLLPGHTADRRAHRFIGCDVSGLDVQWQSTAFTAGPRRNLK